MARMWEKSRREEFLVDRDWTPDLNGKTIVGLPEVDLPPGSDLELMYVATQGNVNIWWLRGGEPGRTLLVVLRVNSSNGEVLEDEIPVRIRRAGARLLG